MPGDVSLEAALDLAWGLAFGGAFGGVGAGSWVVLKSGEDDRVQGAVELAVAAAVEAVADGLAGGGGDRRGPAEHRERGVAAQAAGVRPGAEQLRGADRPDADLVEQPWDVGLDSCSISLSRSLAWPRASGSVWRCGAGRSRSPGALGSATGACGAGRIAQTSSSVVVTAELVAKLLARGDDQRLEMVDRSGSGTHRAAAGDQEHADSFAIAATSGAGRDDHG